MAPRTHDDSRWSRSGFFTAALALLAGAVGAVGQSPTYRASDPLDAPYLRASAEDSLSRWESRERSPNIVAETAGLRPLALQRLPAGTREIRVWPAFSLVSPQHMLRILVQAGDRTIAGEIVVTASTPPTLADDARADDSARVDDVQTWREALAGRAGCESWQPAHIMTEHYDWCSSTRRSEDEWIAVLDSLDSLGVASFGSPGGYNPTPPTRAQAFEAMRDSTIEWPNPGCGDIGSRHLFVEVLDGAAYRQANWGCLNAPRGDEFERARAAFDLIVDFVLPPPTDPEPRA